MCMCTHIYIYICVYIVFIRFPFILVWTTLMNTCTDIFTTTFSEHPLRTP